MDRGNFPVKSAAVLVVARDIHYIPAGERSFSRVPQDGAMPLTGGWGSRNNLQGKASILIFLQSCVSYIWVQPTREAAPFGKQGDLRTALLKVRMQRETEARVKQNPVPLCA